jgi:hypothetical protein
VTLPLGGRFLAAAAVAAEVPAATATAAAAEDDNQQDYDPQAIAPAAIIATHNTTSIDSRDGALPQGAAPEAGWLLVHVMSLGEMGACFGIYWSEIR